MIVSAHSMDTAFYGLDEKNQLVVFYSGEDGVVPVGSARDYEFFDLVIADKKIQWKNKKLAEVVRSERENSCLEIIPSVLPLYQAFTIGDSSGSYTARGYLAEEFDFAFNITAYRRARPPEEDINVAKRSLETWGYKASKREVREFLEEITRVTEEKGLPLVYVKGDTVIFSESRTPVFRYFDIGDVKELDYLVHLFFSEITEPLWSKFKKTFKIILKQELENFVLSNREVILLAGKLLAQQPLLFTPIAIANPEQAEEIKKSEVLLIIGNRSEEEKQLVDALLSIKKQVEPYMIVVPQVFDLLDTVLRKTLSKLV